MKFERFSFQSPPVVRSELSDSEELELESVEFSFVAPTLPCSSSSPPAVAEASAGGPTSLALLRRFELRAPADDVIVA